MIYTIGHTQSYDYYLKHQAAKAKKLGRTDIYPGGFVWETKEEALQYLKNATIYEGYSVYSVDADLCDTELLPGENIRRLLRNSLIIGKVDQ